MPYKTVTANREVTKYRDVIKQGRLGYTEITVHRPKIIFFEFEGMRPNMPHWIFFGNTEITKYCNTSYTLSDYTNAGRNSNIKEPGDKFVNATAFPTELGGPSNGGGSNPLTSNADGSLRGFFYLQSNTTTNFPIAVDGTSFSALDISTMNKQNALSYASTQFHGMGQYENWYEYTVEESKVFTETYTYQEYYDAPVTSSNKDNGPTVTHKKNKSGGTDIAFDYGYETITHTYSGDGSFSISDTSGGTWKEAKGKNGKSLGYWTRTF